MDLAQTIEDEALALGALAWVLGDPPRADRLLALTGLAPDDLRARLDAPETLDAVLGFLEAYQPDLIDCAAHLGISPARLVAARERLSQ